MRKKTLKEFIEQAGPLFDFKYDYSKFVYIDNQTPGIIGCPIHGDFSRRPNHHLSNKSGCPDCSKIETIKKKTKTTEWFVKKAREVQGDKYTYPRAVYKGSHIKLIITCPKHNDFLQSPSSHLAGNGCKACADEKMSKAKTKTQEQYIIDARKVHGDEYDYTKVEYKGYNESVLIGCSTHGYFEQNAQDHLRGRGCPECVGTVSKISQIWLDMLEIPKEHREKSLRINGRLFKLDALDVARKLIHEFYGDWWHGNLSKYNENEIHPVCKITYKELYNKTMERERVLKEAGYRVVSIWESEFLESQGVNKIEQL